MTPDPRRGTFGTIFVILLIAAILCAAVVSFSVMDLNGSQQVGVGISGTPTTLPGPPTPTVTVTVTAPSSPAAIPQDTDIPTAPAPTFTYAVEPGDTLSGLSDKFNVPQEKIYDQNKALIPTDKHLKPGTVLTITPEG